MGLVEENEPPKKKLKQAQLSFTPRSQKRKLVTDLNDDVQIVKVVCKETVTNNELLVTNNEEELNVSDKENHKFPKKPISPELDKNSKCDNGNVIEVISTTNVPVDIKIKKESDKKEVVIDITSTSNSPDLPKSALDTSNTQDLSLNLSDSVIASINGVSTPEVTEVKSQDINEDANDFLELSSSRNTSVSSEEGLKIDSDVKTTTSLSESNDDSDLNKTVNSEDDVYPVSSSEESSEKKTDVSPSLPSRRSKSKRLGNLKRQEEKKRKILEKKAAKAQEKEEKLKKLQEEKKRIQEAREQKRKEEQKFKEEERKIKEEERKKREEEKKQKEEEKKQKEEEKRKREEAKEEEKRRKEEIEEKKKAAFAKFFRKSKQPDITEKPVDHEEKKFMPFPVKPDMKLAPQCRRILNVTEKTSLDSTLLREPEKDYSLYIGDLKSAKHVPMKKEATWPISSLEEEDHDVIIIESTENGDCIDLTNCREEKCQKKRTKAKLLQFHDNRRPPYYGTWRKKSSTIGPRKPLGQDKVIFDYDVDSDSEWEDEGEGEDIEKEGESDGEQSEEEADAQGENGYILDNTFVPHGYLSDEEVQPDEDLDDNDPENQKLRMKFLKQEFDEEMKTKTERLKPRLLGFVWISNGTTEVSPGSLYERLMSYRAVWNEEDGPIEVIGSVVLDSPSVAQLTKKVFPQPVLSTLVKFVHGCQLPFSSLFKNLLALIEKEHSSERISKRSLSLKVKEVATKTYDYASGKPTWTINSSLCQEFGLMPIIVDSNPPPPPPPPPVQSSPNVEKPKDNALLNYLKGPQTPTVKKKVPFITLSGSSFDYTPSKFNNKGGINDFGTPRPAEPVVKKRAQFITLGTRSSGQKSEPISSDSSKTSKNNNELDTSIIE